MATERAETIEETKAFAQTAQRNVLLAVAEPPKNMHRLRRNYAVLYLSASGGTHSDSLDRHCQTLGSIMPMERPGAARRGFCAFLMQLRKRKAPQGVSRDSPTLPVVLVYLCRKEDKVTTLQALWRGRVARKSFVRRRNVYQMECRWEDSIKMASFPGPVIEAHCLSSLFSRVCYDTLLRRYG